MTLTEVTTAVSGIVTANVPDLAVYIAAGVVIALGVYLAKRFIKAGH